MATSADRPRARDVTVTDLELTVSLEDGRSISVPLDWFPRLKAATPAQRGNWQLIGRGIGIRWDDVDEDVSVDGLLRPEGVTIRY
jgi:hypothetical protein